MKNEGKGFGSEKGNWTRKRRKVLRMEEKEGKRNMSNRNTPIKEKKSSERRGERSYK